MVQDSTRTYTNIQDFPIGIFSKSSYLSTPHHHIEYEILYVDKGQAILGIDNKEIPLSAGSVAVITPETPHFISQLSNEVFHYYAIVFDAAVIGNEGDSIRNIFDGIRTAHCITLPENILANIRKTAEAEKKQIFGKDLFKKTLLFEIISYIVQSKQYIQITSRSQSPRIHSINAIDVSIKYLHDHYRENISMDDLLEITSYSKSHFIRLFKKYTGMNLTDYINKYRIEKACLDLIYTTKNITEIATENGFNTVQYFSKTFKSYMNCTPKKYQKEGKNIMIPSSLASID